MNLARPLDTHMIACERVNFRERESVFLGKGFRTGCHSLCIPPSAEARQVLSVVRLVDLEAKLHGAQLEGCHFKYRD
jgi:hypothetical protein